MGVVAPTEADLTFGQGDEARVGDGDAVSVTREMGKGPPGQLLDRSRLRRVLARIATYFVRRLAPGDVEITYSNGLWTHRVESHYFPDGPTFDYTYSDFRRWNNQAEYYITETRDLWLRHYTPRRGDIVIDVGAGHGENTLTFSRAVGETGRVIAIEAHPGSFRILKVFCELNQLSNVTPLEIALMDKPGTVRMVDRGRAWMQNEVQYGDAISGMQMPANTLDEICREQGIQHIDFIKMNIEGAERYAVLGMQATIARVRQICIACHDFRFDRGEGEHFRTRAFVERFLTSHGFVVISRLEDPQEDLRDIVYGLRVTEETGIEALQRHS